MSGADAQIVDLYQRHGLRFDRHRRKTLFEKHWLDRFVEISGENAAILDLGCGSGEPIARYLIEKGHDLTGTDTSGPLLELCRDRFSDHDWIKADMRELHLPERFNGILAWNSFFHLNHDDQRQMFPIFRSHAAPGAALMFTSGTSHGETIGDLYGEPLYHGSLDKEAYTALLAENGFSIVEQIDEDKDCRGHTVWLAVRD